jgi:putative tryptophan/tyrosine transport system substrate-binding protein
LSDGERGGCLGSPERQCLQGAREVVFTIGKGRTKMKRIAVLLTVMILAVLCVGLLAVGCGSNTTTTVSSEASAATTVSTASAPSTTAAAKMVKIGITQIATNPDLDGAKKAFVDKMTELGWVEGQNVQYEMNNPEADMSLAASIAKKYVSEKLDLIYAITTPSAQACATAAKDTSIPIVFSNVTDPIAAGLATSWDKSGGNICGVSDWTDVTVQMKLIQQIMPNMKTLGLIYNAGETNAVVQVNAVKEAAKTLGFSTVEATAAATADVLVAANSLVGRCDAFWFGTDNVMASAVNVLVKVAEDNKLPLFGSSLGHVQDGVIASEGVDEIGNGTQAAIMADKVLKGANPGDMAVYKQPTDKIYVNPAAAGRMGVTIPEAIVSQAAFVVK